MNRDIFKDMSGNLDDPIDEKMEAMMREQGRLLDEEIKKAITKFLGTEDWDAGELGAAKRLTRIDFDKLTYLSIDGELLISYGPCEMVTESEDGVTTIHITRGFKSFV